MKLMKKTAAALALVLAMGSGAVYADEEISVRMDGVASDGVQYVEFTRMAPIQVDSRTLTPARDMAEAAGMDVEWDQPAQTAILTLKADASSDKPIERFAAEVIEQIHGFGLDLTPVSITAALKLNESSAVIRYNFVDSDGDIVPIGKDYEMTSRAIFIEDGTLMIPIRDSMEMFGLTVDWSQEELCASVSIPEEAYPMEDISIIANHGEGKYAASEEETAEAETTDDGVVLGEYIGNFRITHYCPCSICNGGWGAYTAWAGEMTPGRTIAVNTSTIPKMSWVYVEGYGLRRAEDTGSSLGAYQLDMAVPTHEMAYKLGVVYRDVYFAASPEE